MRFREPLEVAVHCKRGASGPRARQGGGTLCPRAWRRAIGRDPATCPVLTAESQ